MLQQITFTNTTFWVFWKKEWQIPASDYLFVSNIAPALKASLIFETFAHETGLWDTRVLRKWFAGTVPKSCSSQGGTINDLI